MTSRHRKNISKPITWTKRKTSVFTPLYRNLIGIRISGNSVGYIQTTITLSIFVKEIQNFYSNSSPKCLLSKTFSPLLQIPYRSKVIVETVSEVHISTHFQMRWTLVNNRPLKYFFSQNLIVRWLILRYKKIFQSQFLEQNVRLPFLHTSVGI